MKKIRIIVLSMLVITLLASCNSTSAVSIGNYYLDGNKSNEYIQIISGNKMKFIGFDIDHLTDYLISEGTDFEGEDAKDFMERHNLPDVFNQEIEFEFNEDENNIYVMALSNKNADYPVVNYRMVYENKNTITFMGNTYLKKEAAN